MDIQVDNRPRLVVLTTVLRSDFHDPLKHFRHFQVWHLYARLASDLEPSALGPCVLRYRNLVDLVSKTLRLRPALLQGGEPCDFPTQFVLILGTLIAATLLRVPYYAPIFENLPIRSKYSDIRRFGVQFGPLVGAFVRRLTKTYAARASLLFAPNQGARQNLAEVGVNADKVSELLYATWGVDLDLFSPQHDGHEPNMGPHGILYVGRLTTSKGVGDLLRAFLGVRRSLPDARLFLAGDGDMKPEIEDFIREHNLTPAVCLLGTIMNHDLPPFFRAAVVTVSPSRTTPRWAEQVGMVNIQSMACGTPVISTRSGAIPEFVADGRTGILVPERDIDSLTMALLRILTDFRLRSALSQNARRYAIERYDARRNVKVIDDLLAARFLGKKLS